MPDSPDYSQYRVLSSRVSLSDMGELAARLGAVQRLYREGTIITYDDFSNGLSQCFSGSGGAGSAVNIKTLQTFTGGYNIELLCGTGSTASASVQYFLAALILGRIGVEVCFIPQIVCDDMEIIIYLYGTTGTYTIKILFDFVNETLSYYGSDGSYHVFGSIGDLFVAQNVIHFTKIVFDTVAGNYVKFILDDSQYDLSANSINFSAGTPPTKSEFLIRIDGQSGETSTVYLNHVIITCDEP